MATTSNLTMSVDDGCASDIRAAALGHRYSIPTVFYWPVEWHSLAVIKEYEPLKYEEALMISKLHEIGSHTVTHRLLTRIPYGEACAEIAESRMQLQELFDVRIKKFCPPRGYINPPLRDFALTLYDSIRLTRGAGLVHVHPDSGANGNIPWRDYARRVKKSGQAVEIWGHSYEWDRFGLWDELEDFIREHTNG